MALIKLIVSPRDTGKTTAAHALQEKYNAWLIPHKMSSCSVPRGCRGPFIIDELSRQTKELQLWAINQLIHSDFYIFCDSGDLHNLIGPWQRLIANQYPEYLI